MQWFRCQLITAQSAIELVEQAQLGHRPGVCLEQQAWMFAGAAHWAISGLSDAPDAPDA